MTEIEFYNEVNNKDLKMAVIIAKYRGKWIFCKHKERETYELPGGHREIGEAILDTAKREIVEETGAIDFNINPICMYSVKGKEKINQEFGEKVYGMLFIAEVFSFEKELHSEIEKVVIAKKMVDNLTYPLITHYLFNEAKRRNFL